MTTRPLVCVLEKNNLYGWPPTINEQGKPNRPAGAESVAYMPLPDALRCDADSDLHLVQYSVPDLPHRLSEGAPERLALDGGAGVPMVLLIVDVDCPKTLRWEGKASPEWRAVEQVKISRLRLDEPGVLAYQSRGGYRLLAWLPEPHVVSDRESARAWRELYLCHVADLYARYEIRADPKCSEWQHLQRAPLALRGDQREPGDFTGSPDAVGAWDFSRLDPERALEAMRRLAEQHKGWKQALAFLEGPTSSITADDVAEPTGPVAQLKARLFPTLVPAVRAVAEGGGRHTMYLALSGVLLDRGVAPDALPDLIGELSEAAGVDEPRLVQDRIKTARSTVSRAASGEIYSRVGVLARDYLEVARAVDLILPSVRPPCEEGILRALTRGLAPPPARALPALRNGSDLETAQVAIQKVRAAGSELAHDRGSFWVCPPGEGVWTPEGAPPLEYALHELDGAPLLPRGEFKADSSSVRGALSRAATLLRAPDFFDTAPAGIAFANGFLYVDEHVGTAVLLPPGPDHRAIASLAFPYDDSATCPRWLTTLDGIFLGDPEAEAKIALLQEYVGSALLGLATRWQCCLVLDGSGANGKSTVLKVVSALAPPGSRRSIPPQRWGGEYYIAAMSGALLNVVAEMPRTDLENSESFKAIVAGDEVTGRRPRGEPFDFKPRAGHLFACNELPGTSDQSDAYWRRFRVITFGRKFSPDEQVRDLAEQIAATELPGIAAWAVEGACRALRNGALTEVGSSDRRLSEWRKASDQVALFAADRLEHVEGESSDCTRMYQTFADWARSTGHKGMSQPRFEARLLALGWSVYRNGVAVWANCRLRGGGFAKGVGTFFNNVSTVK